MSGGSDGLSRTRGIESLDGETLFTCHPEAETWARQWGQARGARICNVAPQTTKHKAAIWRMEAGVLRARIRDTPTSIWRR